MWFIFITCMNINLARVANFSCVNQSEITKCSCKLKFIFVGTGTGTGTGRKLLVQILEDIL